MTAPTGRPVYNLDNYSGSDDSNFGNAISDAYAAGGGVVYAPPKSTAYSMSSNHVLPATVDMVCDGYDKTVFDFNGQSSGDAITVQSAFNRLEGFKVQNAYRHNFAFQSAGGGAFSAHHLNLKRLSSLNPRNGNNYDYSLGYLISMEQVYAEGGTNGHYFNPGFFTTVSAINCGAGTHANESWHLDSMVYSKFDTCYGGPSRRGFYGRNLNTVNFVNCGAEDNTEAPFYFESNSTVNASYGGQAGGIYGVKLDGCFGVNNGDMTTYPNTSSNLLTLDTDGSPCFVTVTPSCHDLNPASGVPSLNCKGGSIYDQCGRWASQPKFKPTGSGGLSGISCNRLVAPQILYKDNISLTTGAAVPICQLYDLFGTPTYSGEITISAAAVPFSRDVSFGGTNTAFYKLRVTNPYPGATIVCSLEFSAGLTTGGGTSWPSFTWTINSSGQLCATRVGSTSGSFYFMIQSYGNVSPA